MGEKKSRARAGDLLAVLVLVVATIAFCRMLVLQRPSISSRVPFAASDMYSYFYPKFVYGNQVMRSGRFPLWNPYEFCGIPFLATLQVEALYPVKVLLFLLFSPGAAIRIYYAFHIFANAFFSYLFFRVIRYSRQASLFASSIWAFSGSLILGCAYHPNRIASLAWFPFCLFCLHMVLTRATWRWSLLLAIGVAMQFLVGTPAFMIYSFFFLLVYYAFFMASSFGLHEMSFDRFCRINALLIVSAGAGFILTAAQFLPFYEMLRVSHRTEGFSGSTIEQFRQSWVVLPRLETFFSFFFNWRGGNTFGASYFFMGFISAILMLLGAIFSKRPMKWFFFGSGIFLGCLFLFPGFHQWLHGFPPFKYDRFAVTPFFFVFFFLAGIAGGGLDYLKEDLSVSSHENEGNGFQRRRGILLLIVYGLILCVLLTFNKIDGYESVGLALLIAFMCTMIWARSKWMRESAALLVVGLFLATYPRQIKPAVKEVQLPRVGVEELADVTSSPAVKSFIERNKTARAYSRDMFLYGKHLAGELPLVNGLEYSLQIQRMSRVIHLYTSLFETVVGRDVSLLFSEPAFLNLMGASIIFLPEKDSAACYSDAERFELLDKNVDGRYSVFIDKRALPRCFLVHRARIIKDEDEIFQDLRAGTVDPASEVILEEDLSESLVLAAAAGEEQEPSVVKYAPEEVIIEASPNAGAFLVLTDSYYPGWKAYDNGKEAHIYRADYLFRAVYLEPGGHTIRFSYEPASFNVGYYLSLTGWVLVGLFFAYSIGHPLHARFFRRSSRKQEEKGSGSIICS